VVVSIANLTVGERLPERKFEVTRTAVVRYAGASGDFNPLHHDDAAARAAGMTGAFAHGMFSAGCLATAVTDAVGVESLTRLTVRFRTQAPLGTSLTSGIVVTGTRHDGDSVIVDLDCHLVADDAVVVSGVASVATPPRPQEPEDPGVAPESSTSNLVGKRLMPAVVTIERGPVQFFAIAVGNDSAVYRSPEAAAACGLDGLPVPPTYVFAAAHWGTFADRQPPAPEDSASLVELIALLRNGRKGVILHGEQEFRYYIPLRVGEILYADGYVEAVEEKAGTDNRAGMTVMVVRTDYRNAPGQLLTTARATYLFRPAARE
jgi:acyl dehydratase